ncbi:MAG: NAD(P)-binding protein [Spirochaetota bacterium]
MSVFGWSILRRARYRPKFVGPALDRGHQLRERYDFKPGATEQAIPVAIIGGGISGMSAGWYLQKRGMMDFRLFELEDRAGGNAQWGENRNGRYPWGAHYLPTPGPEATWVRELLAEMGIYQNGRFSEEAMVHETEERLFIYGNWQPGLVPLMGARESDRQQIDLFFRTMSSFSKARGRDGRRAFTIPLALSSADPKFAQYDRLTASEYLAQLGITSQRLLWYIDYVLRDEYGSNRHNTSAWALLHYFAARSEAHNLVWPEGNGYIAEYLRRKLGNAIQPATALRQVEKVGNHYRLHFFNHATQARETYRAKKIIFAAPKFILPWVFPAMNSGLQAEAKALVYSPWLTVNLLVNHFGENDPAWDNVIFGSKSLGYVVAEHQRAGKLPHARTLTFFHAFDEDDTLQSRRRLYQMSEHEALQMALNDIGRAHPRVGEFVESAGIYRWAHAMVRPTPGFLARTRGGRLGRIDENFFGAHSDLSGMSNFEEAQYRGVTAAQRVLGEIS